MLIVERLEDDYDDASKIGRLRKWFSIDEANSQLLQHRPIQQEYFDKLCKDKVRSTKIFAYVLIVLWPSNETHVAVTLYFVTAALVIISLANFVT